jgi:hypothetical protein
MMVGLLGACERAREGTGCLTHAGVTEEAAGVDAGEEDHHRVSGLQYAVTM